MLIPAYFNILKPVGNIESQHPGLPGKQPGIISIVLFITNVIYFGADPEFKRIVKHTGPIYIESVQRNSILVIGK